MVYGVGVCVDEVGGQARQELDGGEPGLGREAGPDLGGRDDEIGR